MENPTLYQKKQLKIRIEINAKQIHNDVKKIIFEKVKERVDNKCIEEGYIKSNSIKILHIENGIVNLNGLKGSIIFNVIYEALICNPSQGENINCIISDINKTNVQAYVEDKDETPLKIFLNRTHHQNRQDYVDLKVNDKIKIQVLYKNYEYNDTKILIFGKLL